MGFRVDQNTIADWTRRGLLPAAIGVNEQALSIAPPAETIDEAQFQADVEAFAKKHGWKYYHTRDSRKSVAGFPDLVCVRERLVWIELKVDDNEPSAAQESWHDALKAAGEEVYVFYPVDWPEIIRVLT